MADSGRQTVGTFGDVLDVEEGTHLSSSSDSAEDWALESQDSEQGLVDDSIHCFTGHAGPVYAVCWNSQNPTWVATGGGDDKAFLWQAGEHDPARLEATTHELSGHTDTVASLAFNHSGDLLASGGLDGEVRIWSVTDASCLHILDGPKAGIEWLCWHPKGNVVLAGSEDFSVWMWNAASGAFMQVFTGHSGPVRCGQFSSDGKLVVTGGGDGDDSLKVWDPKNGVCTLTVQDPHTYHTAGLTVLTVHVDNSTVCSGSEDCTARLVNLQTGRVLGVLAGHTDSIEAASFVTEQRLLVTSSIDGEVRIWDAPTLSIRTVCHHDEAVVSLICHPTRSIAFTGCLDGRVRCWDLRTGECLQTYRGHSEGIQSMALHPGGSLLLTGSDDETARLFEFN